MEQRGHFVTQAQPILSMRLLLQACIGVFVGVIFSMMLSSFFPIGGPPSKMPDELLSWNLHNVWLEPREKSFYLISLLLAPLGAYLSTLRLWRTHLIVLLMGTSATIPATNYLAILMMQDDYRVLFCGIFTLLFALIIVINRIGIKYASSFSGNYRAFQINRKLHFAFFIGLTLLLIPHSFTEIATKIGLEPHVVSFLIGPSLYFLNQKLLPGIDYFTQYGIGMGWVFSFLMGSNAAHTILNYIYFILTSIWLFYAHMLYLLTWLFRSFFAAMVVVFVCVTLLFVGDIHFFAPSSSILRFPLLGICASFLSLYIGNRRIFSLCLLAACLAISLFLNTETGIIIIASTILSFLICEPRAKLADLLKLLSGMLSFFIFILLLIFGQSIFSLSFLKSLIEPLLIYGQIGFGGSPIFWSLKYFNWFYNIVAPGVAIATIILILRTPTNNRIDQARLSVLAYFSTCGLLMMAKYVNMSITAVWQMNALGLLVPITWWFTVAANRADKVNFGFNAKNNPILVWALLIICAVGLTSFSSDPRNPAKLGFRSWLLYPSLARSLFVNESGCNMLKCIPNRPAANDVALIKRLTKPKEQVAIFGLYDWAYLIAAHRPPLMFFLPSADIFTKRQLTESLIRIKNAKYLFLPRGEHGDPGISHDDLKAALLPNFHKNYILFAEGNQLVAWKRRT